MYQIRPSYKTIASRAKAYGHPASPLATLPMPLGMWVHGRFTLAREGSRSISSLSV
jgi:hypothetical protein